VQIETHVDDRAGRMGALVEPAPAPRAGDEEMVVAQLFASCPELDALAVLDSRDRPVGVLGVEGELRPVSTVGLEDEPPDVLRQSMLRPRERRFDALVCCDGQGRYLGLVRIERLVAEIVG
jgi:hypothetical protein